MILLLVDNVHVYKTPDGCMYTPSIYDSTFFARYLEVFEEVHLLAKTRYVDSLNRNEFTQLKIERFKLIELPWYQGISQMIRILPRLLLAYYKAGSECNVIIYRVCQIESFFSFILRRNRAIFYLEVVNDPDTFTVLPLWARLVNVWMLRLMLSLSAGASFVTENYLQSKYLSKRCAKNSSYLKGHYSSVELCSSDFGVVRKYGSQPLQSMKIIHVANSIVNDVKGHLTVINVLENLVKNNRIVTVEFVGDGPYVEVLKQYISIRPHLNGRVFFSGRFHDRSKIFERFLNADLFLYPTKLEGLPRSLIEAMATGLPALSTPIAGIPELLNNDCMFQPDDVDGFSCRVGELMDDPDKLTQMSQENILIAQKFENTILNKRRRVFYCGIQSNVLKQASNL